MYDEDLRAFYNTFYADMFVVPYDEAPTALKLRLRLALEMVDGLRHIRDTERRRPKARVVRIAAGQEEAA